MPSPDRKQSKVLTAVLIALPIALIAGVLIIARNAMQNPVHEPVALSPILAPEADSSYCVKFINDLPAQLGAYGRADLREPAPTASAAYLADDSDEPIVVRCGLVPPGPQAQDFQPVTIGDVTWTKASDPNTDSSTWFAINRKVVVAATLPESSGATPIQDLSTAIERSVPELN